MTITQHHTTAPVLTSHADQLAATLRDARCCDALDPCRPCQVGRMTVQVERVLASIPTQRTKESR